MAFTMSEEVLGIFIPIVVFWAYSGLYVMLGPFLEPYKIHTKEEEGRNIASKLDILKGILIQQVVQVALGSLAMMLDGGNNGGAGKQPQPSILVAVGQIVTAMLVMDTYMYFFHRVSHTSKFLYKHSHSLHHRVFVPFPYVANYNHPIESLFFHLGGMLTMLVSGMNMRTSTVFYSLLAIKGVDDHCGYHLPWNPIHRFFEANAAFHDLHHQLDGLKYNFSTPFFNHWDKICGTYAPYELVEREGGGYEVRMGKKKD